MFGSITTRRSTRALRFLTAAVFLTILGISASQSFAADIIALENDEVKDVTARDPGGHWTPEQLLNAQMLEVPISSMSFQDVQAQLSGDAGEASGAGGPVVSEDGQNIPEAQEVQPDMDDRLFPEMNLEVMNRDSEEGAGSGVASAVIAQQAISAQSASGSDSEVVAPSDIGTAGAYFSSSRLVPTNARLHYPYRANGKLFFQKPGGGNFICSATVLRPRLILTAGHCVHKGSGGASGFYRKFLFVPAYHNGSAPYQAWNWRWVITTSEWANSNGSVPNKADLAIIELEDRKFGSQIKKIGGVTGWLGYRTNALKQNHTKKIGYPGNFDSGQIMHQVDSQHFRMGGQNTVLYGSDMRGGSSGGAWIENFGVKAAGQTGGLAPWPNRIIGVTSYGYVATGPKVQGSSILGQSFLNILNSACQHRAGNCS